MNKESNKKANSKKVTMSTNDEIIDKIILKNKEKLDRLDLKEINVEKFSLKNREENTVFYLRKKPRTKSEDSTDSELLGKKIISENISNKGEFTSDTEKIHKRLDVGSEEKKAKKSKRFGKWKKDIPKIDAPPLVTKDLIESKGFDEIVSEIDKIIEYESQSKTEGKKESIVERDIKIDAEKQPSTIEEVISEDKKDIEWSSSTDQLLGFKEISKKKIPVSDAVPSISDRIKKGEVRDVRIDKEVKIKEIKARKKEIKARAKDVGVSGKRFFFKKKKSPDVGVVGSKQDGEEVEKSVISPMFRADDIPLSDVVDEGKIRDILIDKEATKKEIKARKKEIKARAKDVGVSGKRFFFKKKKSPDVGVVGSKQDGEEVEKSVISPMPRIDNIPLIEDVNEDEAKYLDEKIKVYSEKDKSIDEGDQVASKAIKLTKDHIKDKSMKAPEDLVPDKKTKKLDVVAPVGDSIDKEKAHKRLDVGSEEKKAKKSKRFGKWKKDIPKIDAPPLVTKDLIESKGFDEIVSEIDKIIEYESQSKTEGKKESIVERDIKIDAEKQPSTIEEVISEDKKDIEWSSSTDQLLGFKEISKKKIPVSDAVPSISDRIKKGEVRDVRIDKEVKIKEIKARKKEIKARAKDVGVSGKRFFFKKKKSPDVGVVGSKQDGEEVEKSVISPMFRVDNIPLIEDVNEDEAKYLDEKIKVYSEKDKSIDEGDQVASKAIKLTKDHIKDKSMKAPEDLVPDKKTKKLDVVAPVEASLDKEKNIEHEHVFFDEEESSSKGWSPRISKPEKNIVMSQTLPQEEVDSDTLKDVGYIELPDDVLKTGSVKLSDLGFLENQWEEMDFYALNEPFAYVEILREKESLDKCYFLVEIALTKEEEKTLVFILDTMSSLSFDTTEMEEKGYNEYLLERLDQIIQEYNIKLSEESRKKIFYYIGKSSLGLGKIDPLMKDPNIEDISCDGAGVPVFLYHRTFGSLKSNVRFNDEEELSSFVHRLAQKSGKHISIAEPMLDATMPDGSRIQMTLSDEITAKGSTFTIRKFRADPFSPPDLIEFNTMSSEMVAYMWVAVENGINTLFAGGTASGKTTALNALSLFIPRESKIVSIEETREINLPHPNWIPGVARSGFGEVIAGKMIGEIDMYDLMKAALRQRPEYILVGEIRGREAYVLFQAMATGHATYSTVHADSAQSLIHRLEGKPVNIPRVMLQSLDVVCLHVITRVKNMRARRCKQIIEIIDIDPTTKEILTNEVFRWDPVEDRFIYSGKSYVLERVRAEKDLNREEMTQEINNRRKIVEWMNTNNIREFREVSKTIAQYTENSEEMLKQIEKDVK